MTTTQTQTPPMTEADAHQERVGTLIVGAWMAHREGQIPQREWLKFSLMALSQARIVIAKRAEIRVARLRGVDPIGLTPRERYAMDTASLTTCTDDPDDDEKTGQRLFRFITATMDEAEAWSAMQAARRHGAIGWRWRLSGSWSDTCAECRSEGQNRYPRKMGDPFEPAHPGCDCYAEFVWPKPLEDNEIDSLEEEADGNDDADSD